MGEVYRARDTRLGRDVAIKVLPEAFAADGERLGRFQREAQILAALNHPHIAQIHGLEESGGVRALVLELVEGDTLSERLERGPIPIHESLEIGRQIALALEAAHESGVIHRDLKPGNIKITAAGDVKVLDFGLAKGAPGSRTSSDLDLTHSPTRTQAATQAGVVLGTAAYMSPEQARGKVVDRRTDIWSFGCVLYECLTERQAFEGETISDMIARILEREPDWSALPARTPTRVRELLARCLEKDAKKRLRDIGDARLEIESVLATRSSSGSIPLAASDEARAARPSGRPFLIAASFVLGALLGALALSTLRPATAAKPGRIAHLSIMIPEGLALRALACSPDGSSLAMVAAPASPEPGTDPVTRIYLRRMDKPDFTPLPGSEGVLSTNPPQFSADGRALFFVARPRTEGSSWKLVRAAVDGSSPVVAVCDWLDGWQGIRLSPRGDFVVMANRGGAILRLPASGSPAGPPIPIQGGPSQATYRGLSRGSWVGDDVLLLESVSYGPRGWAIGVAALNTTTGKATPLVEEGGYAATLDEKHILFTRSDALLVAPFDPKSLTLSGTPTSVLGGLRTQTAYEPAGFLLTNSGTLLYGKGGRIGDDRQLAFIGRDGEIEHTFAEKKSFREASALPDGRRIAVTATNARGIDEIWVSDVGREGLRRAVAMAGADCGVPLWSPAGDRLAFGRLANDGESGLYIQEMDAAEERRTLVVKDSAQTNYSPISWSTDGKRLLVVAGRPGADDIMLLTLSPDGSWQMTPFLTTPHDESFAAISPNGRWVAFVSDESGQEEVYLCAMRADGSAGSPIPVSRGRGFGPGWIDGGRRIVYPSDAPDRVCYVSIAEEPSLTISAPVERANPGELHILDGYWLPDGRSLVVLRGKTEEDISHVEVALNWTEELKARLQSESHAAK